MTIFKKITRLRERCTERKSTQEAAGAFMTVASKRVHRLWRARRGPRSGSAAMNLVERSGVGLLGIICRDIGIRTLGGLDHRPTVVKNRARAADRINGPPSEGERFGGRLLAHDVGEEWGGGGGNGGHFRGVCGERGMDGV